MELNSRTWLDRRQAPRAHSCGTSATVPRWILPGLSFGAMQDPCRCRLITYKWKWTSAKFRCHVWWEVPGPDLTHVPAIHWSRRPEKLDIRQKKDFLKTKNSYDPLVEFHQQHVVLSVLRRNICGLRHGNGWIWLPDFWKGGITMFIGIPQESVTLLDNLRLADAELKNTILCAFQSSDRKWCCSARALLFEIILRKNVGI